MDKVPISGGACLTLGVFCLGSVGTFDSLIGAAYPAVPVVGGTTMVAPGGELIMGVTGYLRKVEFVPQQQVKHVQKMR